MLRMLCARPACAWCWPAEAQAYLAGTELEAVLRVKAARLASESAAAGVEEETYRAACALAASEANPWFGGSIVPFNWTLNWARAPNVEFEAEGRVVVGRAVRSIRPGEELTQEYADATAELIYRYGFAPSTGAAPDGADVLENDVVSISIDLLISALTDGDDSDASPASELISRGEALCASGVAAPSPWDGLEHILTVELGADGEGACRLIGAAMGLLIPHATWPLVASQIQAAANDDDEAAALLVAAACAVDETVSHDLRRVAHDNGGDDCDPWPALISRMGCCPAVAMARGAARRAVGARRAQLEQAHDLSTPACFSPMDGPQGQTRSPSQVSLPSTPPVGEMLGEAWAMANSLRNVELKILQDVERVFIAS